MSSPPKTSKRTPTELVRYNTYMNQYMKERYRLRREEAIVTLGGKCVHCGITDGLDFDHIDPKTKSATISKWSSVSKERFDAEVAKCQLLCKPCHVAKSRTDGSQINVVKDTECACGRKFTTQKAYNGHRTWCKN